MTRQIFALIFLPLFVISAGAQTIQSQVPVHICGAPPLNEFNAQEYLENLKRDFDAYREFLKEEQQRLAFNQESVTQQMFWAYDFVDEDFYPIQATLRRQAGRVRIWVEDTSWDSSFVTQVEVDAIYNALEVSTPPGSINSGMGIVDIDTMLFGRPPNRNSDGVIDFLILDIKDGFDPDKEQFSFIAGYFSPWDQTNNTGSNQRDLLYLDSSPGIFYNGNRRTNTVLSTTAHELQHLIHFNYDTDEDNWVNEGLSELASAYCGYGIGLPYLYLKDTNRALIRWDSEVRDYARVGLWTLYVAEQLGVDFIKSLTQHPQNGIQSYHTLLPLFTAQNFTQIYENWTLANFINDVTFDSRFGYQHSEARGLKSLITETIYRYSHSGSDALKQYGAKYLRFRGDDTLRINFVNLPGKAVMMWKTASTNSIIPINQNELILPQFNVNDEFVMLLTNPFNEQQYSFNAHAPFSLQFHREVAYDDYQNDGGISYQSSWQVANKFVVPSSGVTLKALSFFNVNSPAAVRIRIYDDNGAGRPGGAISSTIDTTIVNPNSWAEINLETPITGLSNGQPIYIGIEFTQPDRVMGYDLNNSGEGISFVNVGSGWRSLSSAASALNGVFMIRAVFEGGLIESGQIAVGSPIAFLTPNPSLGSLFLNVQLNGPGEIRVQLYNVLGQKVGEFKESFSASVARLPIQLNAGQSPAALANGVYFSTITFRNSLTGEKSNLGTQRIIFLK